MSNLSKKKISANLTIIASLLRDISREADEGDVDLLVASPGLEQVFSADLMDASALIDDAVEGSN